MKDVKSVPQARQPGREALMDPKPKAKNESYRGSDKLKDKVALITGGDSGIGRAVAILFAKEGADVAILYLEEHQDASETEKEVTKTGRRCVLIPCDIRDERACQKAVEKVAKELGRLDIVINNAAEQHLQDSIEKISSEQLESTFRTNVFAMFYIIKAALQYLKKGAAIINTTSITAYKGNPKLLDYSASKGAIVSFTRSLARNLIEKGIRVNAVAPGPIWTPLIASTFPEEKIEKFGDNTPMKRAGEPAEVAPCFLFLASDDSSYISGQVLHPNGGEIVNG